LQSLAEQSGRPAATIGGSNSPVCSVSERSGGAGMTKALVKSSNIQTLDKSKGLTPQQLRNRADNIQILYKAFANAASFARRFAFEVGRELHFAREQMAHGQWEPFIADLTDRLKVSRSSLYNYVEDYKKLSQVPDALLFEATAAGVELEKRHVRDVLVLAHVQYPEMDTPTLIDVVQKHVKKLALVPQMRSDQYPVIDIVFDKLSTFSSESFLGRVPELIERLESRPLTPADQQTLSAILTALEDISEKTALYRSQLEKFRQQVEAA
jgi:hypothetical protein